LSALKSFDEQIAVLIRARRGLLNFGRHFVGVKLDDDILIEQLLDFRLREHTVLVDRAIRSGQAGKVDEDQFAFVARFFQTFFEAAETPLLQVRQEERIKPGEHGTIWSLFLVRV
jgi:hypothetical protein